MSEQTDIQALVEQQQKAITYLNTLKARPEIDGDAIEAATVNLIRIELELLYQRNQEAKSASSSSSHH